MRLLAIVFCACVVAAQQSPPDWQIHLDWSIHDQGHVDCGEQYSPYPTCAVCTPDWKGHPDCLDRGGRACVMSYAIRDARSGHCDLALEEALVTQCHNSAARKAITGAGISKVCAYLRGKTAVTGFKPVPKAGEPTPAFDAHGHQYF
jgi:hypothetical protein